MTKIKAGFIGKLNMVHEDVRNHFYSPFDLQGQIVIVTDVTDDSFGILNESYQCRLDMKDFEVKSTRLKTEVREGLNNMFKHFSKIEKIRQQIMDLNAQSSMIRCELQDEQEKMKKYSDVLTASALKRITPRLYSTKADKDSITISIGFEQCLAKYVQESQYSFIYTEYDNSIGIYNANDAIKEVGLDISRFENNVNTIKEVAKKAKGITYNGISDDVWIGDKNTLYVAKFFSFTIKRSITLEEAKEPFAQINKQIEIMDKYFENRY